MTTAFRTSQVRAMAEAMAIREDDGTWSAPAYDGIAQAAFDASALPQFYEFYTALSDMAKCSTSKCSSCKDVAKRLKALLEPPHAE